MLLTSLLFVLLTTVRGDDFIYHLNESEYSRMPPLYHLDEYEGCLREDGGVYCTVNFHLVTDQPTPLYDLITRYSAHRWTHYNHTLPQYGICLTRTCQELYQRNVTADPSEILEACLNKSLWTEYELKARVEHNVKCERLNDRIAWDTVDTVVALVVTSLLMLNIVGSFREIWHRKDNNQGNKFLECFSIGCNWRKLTSPAGVGPDPRLTRLKMLNGMRTILIVMVLIAHTAIPILNHLDNTKALEEAYYDTIFIILTNGSLMIQFFILISGFLFSHQMMLYKETHKITWQLFPIGIVKRLLRSLPVYILVLAVTATLPRHANSGPLWQAVLGDEIEHCRRDWWHHLLFINNYSRFYNGSQCLPNAWYIALDTQLYIVGLMVFIFVKETKVIKVLTALFITGMVTTAAHTYYHDLDANLLFTPESNRMYYATDKTFKYVYARFYTNLSSYTVGLVTGLLVYQWQKKNYQFNPYLKHRFLTWMVIPIILCGFYINRWFYADRSPPPAYVRALSAAIIKPTLCVALSFAIISLVFKFEKPMRRFFEADIWRVPARVSYSMAVNNIILFKFTSAIRSSLWHFSVQHFWLTALKNMTLSFVLAIMMHLLVDLPFQNLVKLATQKKAKKNI